MTAHHVPKGHPVHDAERRGLQALVAVLPDTYTVYSNIELPTGHPGGHTYEHDAVVVAPHAVFTVELKSWGGAVHGNRDRWTLHDGTVVQSPIPLVLAKARTLKGRLQARRRDLASVWVQGLVFLTAADAAPQISADFEDLVVVRRDLTGAFTRPDWLGNPPNLTPSQRNAILDFLEDGRPTRQPERLNDFKLLARLPAEDRPYEAWLAQAELTGERRVLHAYTVSGEHDAERERLRAHALREATLHGRLQGGPDVLRYFTYFVTTDDPQRIVLLFEDTTPFGPLDAWVRDRNPPLSARLVVAARLARALAWVHDRGLVHRRLSPDAVLLSPEDTPREVRLCAFDLARDITGTAPTITGSSLGDPSFRCTAPEVLRTSEATTRSDLFSLGATLTELFTGRPLFQNADEVLRPIALPPLVVGDRPVPRPVVDLVRALLQPDPAGRTADAAEAARTVDTAAQEAERPGAARDREPGDVLRDNYELVRRLGRGATATTWEARHLQTDERVVLKIADADHAALVQEEGRVLGQVRHPNLVRYYNVETLPDGNMLVVAYVEGVTATVYAGAGDPLPPPAFRTVTLGLLGALGEMHAHGWLHRDVKPDNVMLRLPSVEPVLLDVGLARRVEAEGDLAVGSVRYKDPLVYVENRWTTDNDLFSAFLVLYEVLTGSHPFGGVPPEPGQEPVVEEDQFPESWTPGQIQRMTALFRAALAPRRADRPATSAQAIRTLDDALTEMAKAPPSSPALPVTPVAPAAHLPADLAPDTPVADLPLSARAQGALARLGMRVACDLASLDRAEARRMSNVGKKTLAEIASVAEQARRRWPDCEISSRPPPERFYPLLAGDLRPVESLGRALTPMVRQVLAERGLRTVGDLASLPPNALRDLPFVGPECMARIREAMHALSGRAPGPDTLAALDDALRTELKASRYAALATVLGLGDGVVRTFADAGARVGVSRQRIHQVADLAPLRAEASVAHHLLVVVHDVLPPVGLARIEDVARALAVRLPVAEPPPSALGYARLAALLLRPDARASDAADTRYVLRPPWTHEQVDALIAHVARIATWPPLPRERVEVEAWDLLPPDLQRALARWGADAPGLLDALLALSPDVLADRRGGLYQPPVPLANALALLRPALDARASADALVAAATETFEGVEVPEDPSDALEAAGYRRDGDRWADPARAEAAVTPEVPRLDPAIPRQRAAADGVPPVILSLAHQADRGGFRVVAMPPERHHRLSVEVARWLGQVLGPDRVRYLHVDRVLLRALKDAGHWRFVPALERSPSADWRVFWTELRAALDDAVREAVPGRVTVLGQPALLGTFGLMDWLSGFYEAARGGRHGLVVLTVPGGIHDDRVRLNERHNLPYTPDMAAVYLEGGS